MPSWLLAQKHLAGALSAVLLASASLLPALGCGGSTEDRIAEVHALQDAGQFSESIQPLRDLLARNPDLAEANYLLGVALVQTGQPSLAVWPLEKAAESPDYAEQAGILLASTFVSLESYDDAIRVASKVLERDPSKTSALRIRTHALLGANRRDEALQDAERLQEVAPDDFQSILLYGTILAETGHLDESEKAYQHLEETSAKSTDPGTAARGCLARASFYEDNRKDDARAEAHYRHCLELHPTDPFTLRLVTQFFDKHHRQAESMTIWKRAVESQPENLSFRQALAGRYEAAGQVDRARAVLKQGVELLGTAPAWMALADFERRLEHPKEALDAIEQAKKLSAAPSQQLSFLEADLLIDLDRIDEAQKILDSLQEPAFRDLLNGRILLSQGDAKGALAAFDSGLRRWPNNAGGRFLAGLAARDSGDFARAISELRESVRVDPSATDASLALASLELARGDAKTAADFARMFIDQRSGARSDGYRVLVKAQIDQQLYDAARRTAENLREAGFPTEAAVALADVESAAKNPAAAAKVIQSSGVDPTRPENEAALRALADALLAAGHSAEATAVVDRAVAAHPDQASFHELRGVVMLRQERRDEARQSFEKALQLDPDEARAKAGMAELAFHDGDAKRAIALYDEAARANPKDVSAAYSAAQVALATGDRDGARQRLEDVIRRDPGHAYARNDLAWLLAQSGEDLDRALALAKLAHRIQPGSADIADTLGFVHLQRGENDQAAALFEQAAKAKPGSQSIRYHLGLALSRQGEHDRALVALRQALEPGPFPEAEAARSEIARLEQK